MQWPEPLWFVTLQGRVAPTYKDSAVTLGKVCRISCMTCTVCAVENKFIILLPAERQCHAASGKMNHAYAPDVIHGLDVDLGRDTELDLAGQCGLSFPFPTETPLCNNVPVLVVAHERCSDTRAQPSARSCRGHRCQQYTCAIAILYDVRTPYIQGRHWLTPPSCIWRSASRCVSENFKLMVDNRML